MLTARTVGWFIIHCVGHWPVSVTNMTKCSLLGDWPTTMAMVAQYVWPDANSATCWFWAHITFQVEGHRTDQCSWDDRAPKSWPDNFTSHPIHAIAPFDRVQMRSAHTTYRHGASELYQDVTWADQSSSCQHGLAISWTLQHHWAVQHHLDALKIYRPANAKWTVLWYQSRTIIISLACWTYQHKWGVAILIYALPGRGLVTWEMEKFKDHSW